MPEPTPPGLPVEYSKAPHLEWIKELNKLIKQTLPRASLSADKLRALAQNPFAFSFDVKSFNVSDLHVMALCDILDSIEDAQEIYVTSSTQTAIGMGVIEAGPDFLQRLFENITDIKFPFEQMVITLESPEGEMYSPTFYSVYKMHEKYIRDGKEDIIYNIKACRADQDGVNKMISQFFVVPSLLPRIFIHCEQLTDNIPCKQGNPASIFKEGMRRAYGKDDTDGVLSACLKSPRTCDRCPTKIKTSDENSYEKPIVNLLQLYFVWQIMNRLCRQPRRFKKFVTIDQHTRKLLATSSKPRDIYDRSVIHVSETRIQYMGASRHEIIHRAHGSPCEHLRRGHFRCRRKCSESDTCIYRDRPSDENPCKQRVWIEDVIVNEGGKKPLYIL